MICVALPAPQHFDMHIDDPRILRAGSNPDAKITLGQSTGHMGERYQEVLLSRVHKDKTKGTLYVNLFH